MDAFFSAIQNTPLPTIFVVAGIVFWVLAIAGGSIIGKFTVRPDRQRTAGILGTLFLALGLALYVVPIGHTPPTPAPQTTQPLPQGTQPPAQDTNKQFADSVIIQSIGPRTDVVLRKPTDIQLDLVYSLFSADKAILGVFLEQFPKAAAGCGGDKSQTNGGSQLHIARGEHFVTMVVHWPGAGGQGFLTVGANFWKDVDGQPVGPPTQLGLFRDLCYTFGP